MARAPFNVLVFPYIRVGGDFEYALLRRSDAGFWHGVAGGGEDSETPLEAAKRETYEETGIPLESSFLQLDTVNSIPVIAFAVGDLWGKTFMSFLSIPSVSWRMIDKLCYLKSTPNING